VGEEGAATRVETLRTGLAAVLPEYMVPAAYVRMASLPLNPNGKLDRKALPAPDAQAYASRAYEAPEGPTETTLAQLWSELLQVPQVSLSRHDDFFALGGHSLLAVSLMERMRQAGLSLDVSQLFSGATLASLAKAVGGPPQELFIPLNTIASSRAESSITLNDSMEFRL
jgi:aryl carrier-like protein